MRSSGRLEEARPARWAVSVTFMVMGLTNGVWNARIPAAKSQVHLSDGTLGIALFAVPLGLVLGAALAERLVDRAGSALLARICGVGNCAAVVTPGLARTLPELMAALFAIGVFGGVPATSSGGRRASTGRSRRQVRRLVLMLGVLAVCGLVAEGAAGDWSAVYLRDNLGTSAGLAALGFAAFSVTMTVGRGFGDLLIHRFGVVPVIRGCGVDHRVHRLRGRPFHRGAAGVRGRRPGRP